MWSGSPISPGWSEFITNKITVTHSFWFISSIFYHMDFDSYPLLTHNMRSQMCAGSSLKFNVIRYLLRHLVETLSFWRLRNKVQNFRDKKQKLCWITWSYNKRDRFYLQSLFQNTWILAMEETADYCVKWWSAGCWFTAYPKKHGSSPSKCCHPAGVGIEISKALF